MAEKTQKRLLIAFVVLVVIALIGVTYAFFTGGVNVVSQQTVVSSTGTMKLVMNDGNTGWSEVWDFGESKSKTLTLQNTGNQAVTVDLYWKNLVNTYLDGSMVYNLKQKTDTNVETYLKGTSTTYVNIPRSTTSSSTNKIAKEITVPAGKTYTYTLTIKLVDSSSVDQTADASATFATSFDIQEHVEQQEITLANYLKQEVYGTDSTLYLHSNTATGNNETSIANWTNSESGNANDGAYRYSGPDASVNNYVCFNYTSTSDCTSGSFATSDYAYRIISVEGDNVKLIKAQPLNSTYAWNSNAVASGPTGNEITETKPYKVQQLATTKTIANYNDNDWVHSSTLNAYLNNDTSGYLSTFSYSFRDKIATNKTWYIGGYSTYGVKVKTFYNAEHGTCTSGTCPGTTDTTTKIGLMNVYDYGYAESPTSWAIDTLGNYNNSTIKASNWLYRSTNSSYEWTITPSSSNAYSVWYVDDYGFVNTTDFAFNGFAVRPVFYLTSDTNYVSGSGASNDPFIVS